MKKLLITTALALVMPIYAHALSVNAHANVLVRTVPLASSTNKIETKTTTDADTTSTVEQSSPADIFTACSQAAIDARDNAIGAARAAYNNRMQIALDARKNAEKDAVAISDEGTKKEAVTQAVNAYKTAFGQAQEILIKARKDAWAQFQASINACRNPSEGAPTQNTISKNANLKATAAVEEGKSLKNIILDTLKSLFSK